MEGQLPPDAEAVSRRRRWTTDEDDALMEAVRTLGPQKWGHIALTIGAHTETGARNASQCRERWYDHLSPDLCKAPWTEEEDIIIELGVASYGRSWSKIAGMLGRRSSHAIRNRYASLSRVERPRRLPAATMALWSKGLDAQLLMNTIISSRTDDSSTGSDASPPISRALVVDACLVRPSAGAPAMVPQLIKTEFAPAFAPQPLAPQPLGVPSEMINALMDDWLAASLDAFLADGASQLPPRATDGFGDGAGVPAMAFAHAMAAAHAQAAEMATMRSPLLGLGLERAPPFGAQPASFLPADFAHAHAHAIPPFAFSTPPQTHALPMHGAAPTALWATRGLPGPVTAQPIAPSQPASAPHPSAAQRARVLTQLSQLPGVNKSSHVMQMPNTTTITRRTFAQPTDDSPTGVVRLALAPVAGQLAQS